MVKIQTIKRNSSRAFCGTFEKEVVVDSDEVAEVKRTLKSNGFIVIGTGPGPFPGTTKIWYNPLGMNF